MPPALPRRKIEDMGKHQPVQVGKYLLIARLGTGGMAEVYRGKLIGAGAFSKTVAIKRILADFCTDPEFKEMFEREAVLSGTLNHPNIVQTNDYIASEEGFLLVMEYINGRNLSQLQAKVRLSGGELPAVLAGYFLSEIAKGLDYAHTKKDERGQNLKIVHRDISPHNIMVGFDGSVKILDFGIAKTLDNGAQRTATGVLKGKLAYMSPEQAVGKPVGVYTDIYAMGLLLYELLTGVRAISASTEMEAIELAREGNFPPPLKLKSSVPTELNAITMRALAKNPENRYQSAAEMYQDLQTYLSEYLTTPGQKETQLYMESLYSKEIAEEQNQSPLQQTIINPVSAPPPHPLWAKSASATDQRIRTSTLEQASAPEPITISIGWVLIVLGLVGLGFGYYKLRPQMESYYKSITRSPAPAISAEPAEPNETPDTIEVVQNNFVPSKYKAPEETSPEVGLLQSKGGSSTVPSAKLNANQALIYFRSTTGSENATLRILWRDANGEGGGFDGCRIHTQSVCPPELLQGTPPFNVTIQPYQRTPGGHQSLFSAQSCNSLGNFVKYDKALGSCTVSIPTGETKLYIHLEKQN